MKNEMSSTFSAKPTNHLLRVGHEFQSWRALRIATLLALLLVGCFGVSAEAGPFGDKEMMGGRLGVWVNTGDDGNAISITGLDQEVAGANLYGELLYSHALSDFFRADIGLGVSNRSDITATGNSFTGQINIYPVQVALRVYPFGGFGLGKLYPYFLGGAGLYIGSQTGSSFRSFTSSSKTATDLNYVLGGGVDVPVAETIAISAAAKYYRIDFGSDKFLGLQDYSGYSITVGVSYIVPGSGSEKR
jgi:outer membrane protein W